MNVSVIQATMVMVTTALKILLAATPQAFAIKMLYVFKVDNLSLALVIQVGSLEAFTSNVFKCNILQDSSETEPLAEKFNRKNLDSSLLLKVQ